MKKVITAVSLLFVGMVFAVCPIPEPCPVPFEHDPNSILYRSLGTITMALGNTLVYDFNACDPDADNQGFQFVVIDAPVEAYIDADGHLEWQPATVGIYYFHIRVTDIPIAGQSLTDTGTFIVRVLPANRPPVIGGCTQQ